MHQKGYISAFHLRQLFTNMPKDDPILSEVIYWFLIENNYQAIGKPQGMSPKEWLLSVDWQLSNSNLEEISNFEPGVDYPAKGPAFLKKENVLVLTIWSVCGLLLTLLVYWLLKHFPTR